MKHIDLERIALIAVLIIAVITLLFIGIYPIFHLTVDPTITTVLAGCTGALFTFLRIGPRAKNDEQSKEISEDDKNA